MSGLIALLDDIAKIAKIAAASVDDIATSTLKAGSKTAGIIIDDAAVTPKYVTGLAPSRELPIIWRITLGSLKNKIFVLLPLLMILEVVWPWVLTPLLMLGGAFLCYEGAEKIVHKLFHKGHVEKVETGDPSAIEKTRISSAVRTDLILSAEIMTLSMSVIEAEGLLMTGITLGAVGVLITFVVYGSVAVLVKMDDLGLWLAQARTRIVSGLGAGIVKVMPLVFSALTLIGTAAMLWVGGNIITHGLHVLGFHAPYDMIHHAAERVSQSVSTGAGVLSWATTAALDGVIGLVLGAVLVPLIGAVKKMTGR